MALTKNTKILIVSTLIGINIGAIITIINKDRQIDKLKEENKKQLETSNKEIEKLKEKLSIKVNSQSDMRLIRSEVISSIKKVAKKRGRDVEEIDILRALKSSENRIMEEYLRVTALVLAIMETETGFTHVNSTNTNGTTDYGIMQVNEVMFDHLKEALGKNLDLINSKDDNVEGGSYEIYECYLKAKEKHPENVIWWTYAYYNRGMYFENTKAWKDPNHPSYKKVHNQADVRSKKFIKTFNEYYEALIALI